MDHSMENIGSHSPGNRPKQSSPIQLNEDIELRITPNAATTNSRNPLNDSDNIFGGNNMSVVDPPSFPTCVNLLGNLEGKLQSHAHGRAENNNSTMSGASQPSNFCYPQMAGSLLNTEGSLAAGVQSQNVGGVPVITSPFHDASVSSEYLVDFSSFFDDIQRPHIDINTIMNESLEHSLGGSTGATNTAHGHGFRVDGDNITTVPSQLKSLQIPENPQRNRITGSNTVAGAQMHSQGGTETPASFAYGINNNNEIRFPGLYNNFQSPQMGRSSINIGSNTPQIMQQKSQARAASRASHVQNARSNSDNFMPFVTQSNNLQRLQVNRSSVRVGSKNACAIQQNCQGETGTGKSQGVTVDGNNDTSIPTLSNHSHGQPIRRSLISTEGGSISSMSVDSLGERRDDTNLQSNASLLNRHQSLLTDRNFINVEDDIHEVQKSQVGGKLMALNNVKTSEKQSVSALCPEEIDNSLLNLGLGDSTPFGFQRNALGGGFSSDNGFPGTAQSYANPGPQTDANFLSLGGNLGNQNRSNNAATAGVTFNPCLSLGGNMENQTSLNNGSRLISGTNGGVNLIPMTNPQAVRGNMYQYASRPFGRIVVPQGNGAGRFVAIPYRGFQGHPSLGMRPLNNIPPGFHANELATQPRLPLRPSPRMMVPTGTRSANLQQAYLNSVLSTNSSMASPLTSTAARAFRQDLSGHPISFENTTIEAAKGTPALSDNHTQMQAEQHTASKRRRGKQVSADGKQSVQPAKVRRGPSVGGKPVPVAGGVGVAQTYEGVLGQSIQSNHTQNVPAITRAPRGRKALQPSINPSPASGNQTKTVYHLKCEGNIDPTVVSKSIGEKCHICKRDLSYTSEGPVTQPTIPPPVAVLHCGHTFHDECLQRITPEDQLKDPPCIPCALGSS
ncbi:hypothetical protein FRX31_016963 [Thalictrum thalictroides]|uniref:RING-type domain-containing protein n=1 Tax=Thalictrum thalictroides TaxID=46969 RepID=A0A7J6W9F1_THATH|nr:hypothetical protein FRX31_016963 [Thalictrum thalictroides]